MASAVSNSRVGRKMARNASAGMAKPRSACRKSLSGPIPADVARGKDEAAESEPHHRKQHGIGQVDPARERRQEADERQQPDDAEDIGNDSRHDPSTSLSLIVSSRLRLET